MGRALRRVAKGNLRGAGKLALVGDALKVPRRWKRGRRGRRGLAGLFNRVHHSIGRPLLRHATGGLIR